MVNPRLLCLDSRSEKRRERKRVFLDIGGGERKERKIIERHRRRGRRGKRRFI